MMSTIFVNTIQYTIDLIKDAICNRHWFYDPILIFTVAPST